MEHDKSTISNLLNESSQIIIPDYQREFVWKDVEGGEFFDDVNSRTRKETLFIGTFIFNKDKTAKEIEVVDGQQRIITILILIIACRVYAKQHGFPPQFIDNLQRRITVQSINPKSAPPCILKTSGRIAKTLDCMADINWDGEYSKSMGSRVGWNKVRKAYEFFYDKLENDNYTEHKVEELIGKVLGIEYIELVVKDRVEAIYTFEVVNARGQHLAVYDLMKAFLFEQSLTNDSGLENIKSEWEEIKENAEHTDNKLKQVLHLFYFSRKGYVLPSNLYRELKKIAKSNPKKFLDELKVFSKFFSVLSKKSGDFHNGLKEFMSTEMKLSKWLTEDEETFTRVSKSLYALRLFKVVSVFPLIYSSLLSLSEKCQDPQKDKKEIKDEVQTWMSMLEFFENFLFVRSRISHGLSKYGGKFEKLYGEYCEKFHKGESDFIEDIKTLQGEVREIKITKEEFVEDFKEISYSKHNDKDIIIYIFDKLNSAYSKPGDPTSMLNLESYKRAFHNIEHIWSQDLKKSKEHKDDIDSIDSIGNLLVIDSKLNSSLGNKPPHEKLAKINEMFSDKEIFNKPYLEDFVNEYGQNIEDKQWGKNLIEKRTEKIASKIYDLMHV